MTILLDTSRRLVIAHRGDSSNAPENTLPAFERGAAAGADALELDVWSSADGVAVVIHDPTLERTTNGTGAVKTRTVAQLKSLDAGWQFSTDNGLTFPYRDRGITISTLAEVLEAFPRIPFVVELKDPDAQAEVLRILTDLNAVERCVLGSFHAEALAGIPRPRFRIGGAERTLIRLYARSLTRTLARSVPFDAIFATRRYHGVPVPVAPFVAAGRKYGIPVHVWVENDPTTALRLWRAGVTGIITNRPALILQARNSS